MHIGTRGARSLKWAVSWALSKVRHFFNLKLSPSKNSEPSPRAKLLEYPHWPCPVGIEIIGDSESEDEIEI